MNDGRNLRFLTSTTTTPSGTPPAPDLGQDHDGQASRVAVGLSKRPAKESPEEEMERGISRFEQDWVNVVAESDAADMDKLVDVFKPKPDHGGSKDENIRLWSEQQRLDLRRECVKHKDTIQKMEVEHRQASRRREEMRDEIAKLEDEIEDLRQRVAGLQDENRKIYADNAAEIQLLLEELRRHKAKAQQAPTLPATPTRPPTAPQQSWTPAATAQTFTPQQQQPHRSQQILAQTSWRQPTGPSGVNSMPTPAPTPMPMLTPMPGPSFGGNISQHQRVPSSVQNTMNGRPGQQSSSSQRDRYRDPATLVDPEFRQWYEAQNPGARSSGPRDPAVERMNAQMLVEMQKQTPKHIWKRS